MYGSVIVSIWVYIYLQRAYREEFPIKANVLPRARSQNANHLMCVGQKLIWSEQGREQEQEKNIKDQKHSMKSTDSGFSGHFSLFSTLGFSSALYML